MRVFPALSSGGGESSIDEFIGFGPIMLRVLRYVGMRVFETVEGFLDVVRPLETSTVRASLSQLSGRPQY